MNFNGQPYMFFDKIIFWTCDLHIKLDILNPLNIFFFIKMVFKMNPLPFQPFPSKFKDFEIFV